MLTDENKTSTLWKNYKGWGSSHANREVFEELYRSFNKISTDEVLTYGYLIPKKSTDTYFEAVQNLDETNNIVYHKESSYKEVPLIKKYINVKLTKISSNCNHAFVILDEDGNQIKNIIPYDFSDAGIYNYTLKTEDGNEISWGICDWVVDTNSSLLTFNNGVPEGIDAEHPPILSFYQYVGPTGERHYIDATLFDIENIEFKSYNPVAEFTKQTSEYLENIEEGFFNTYKFNGSDTNPGIGLQYNIISDTIETSTGDPIKGYDDNSNAQVVHLVSHKIGYIDGVTVSFVSENVANGDYLVEVVSIENGYAKVNVDRGFVVIKITKTGKYSLNVTTTDKIYAVLLVKDNETQDYELFYPRGNLSLTLKVPVFVDLIKLPPHLKLTSLYSFSDHITPQYYGPRVVDFVIASDGSSTDYRSADFVVYNKSNFYLTDAIEVSKGYHILLRNGTYQNGTNILTLKENIYLSGDTKNTILDGITLKLNNTNSLKDLTLKNCKITCNKSIEFENIDFENCTLILNNSVTFKNVNFKNCDTIEIDGTVSFNHAIFEETNISISENSLVVLRNCNVPLITNLGTLQVFDSQISNIVNKGAFSLYNSSVIETCTHTGSKIEINGSYINEYIHQNGIFYINASRLGILNCTSADSNSILDTTNIQYVENLPEDIKINSSYVVKYSDTINSKRYPGNATIPYYLSFEKRIYATYSDPIKFNEETNAFELKLDTIEHTIFINKNGELQVRFFTSKEIKLDNPETYKTQIENVYNQHADTLLETDKPTNVEEAFIDLYWSKADLKNGKVPIDQLPDSVAYGGVTLVGMWQFEDSEGKYPTFEDVDTSYMSDDSYTGLQNGWFFIVKASNKEDDPVYPQKAEDGIEYTAGDWLVYSNGVWEKVDRSYMDPVYSRLPEFAPNSNGTNLAWSVDDNGTGLLNLSYKTLAEALRIINEELYKISPDRAASIQEISVVLDEEKTTVSKKEFIEVDTNLQLNQLVEKDTQTTWDSTEGGRIYFKQKGIHDQLPLEHTFYCGTSSDITVYDGDSNITETNCKIERFDPYEKYRLGFRTPTLQDAAEVTGYIDLGKGAYNINHSIKYTQYNVVRTTRVKDDTSLLEGETSVFNFNERKFYKFDKYSIKQCEESTVNVRVLNSLLANNRTGGYGYIPPSTKVTGTFIVEDFTKYNSISKDANVQIKATFGDIELNTSINSQTLIVTDTVQGIYNLSVGFTVELPDVDYKYDNLTVKAKVQNFGIESLWTNVLVIKDIILMNPKIIPTIVESGNNVLWPTLGNTIKVQFGTPYTIKTFSDVNVVPELVFNGTSYSWPYLKQFVNTLHTFSDNEYIEPNENGIAIGDLVYRFVTFKYSFDSIKDLCGFNVKLNWDKTKPELNSLNGTYKNIQLQICVTSSEKENIVLLDGNSPVPVFFESTFEAKEACNHPGKSSIDTRRITFGRTPVPIQDIYVRVGIPRDSGIGIKGIDIITDE